MLSSGWEGGREGEKKRGREGKRKNFPLVTKHPSSTTANSIFFSQPHFFNELSTFTASNVSPPIFFNTLQISSDLTTRLEPFLPGYQWSPHKEAPLHFQSTISFWVLTAQQHLDHIIHSSVLKDCSIHETTFSCFMFYHHLNTFAGSSFITLDAYKLTVLKALPGNSPLYTHLTDDTHIFIFIPDLSSTI